MRSRDSRGVRVLCAAWLASTMVALTPRPASAWQVQAPSPVEDRAPELIPMPGWKLDFRKADPRSKAVNLPPSYTFSPAEAGTKPEPRSPEAGADLVLEIPIGADFPGELWDQFGGDGLEARLENGSMVLVRTPGSTPRQPEDEILLRVEEPSDSKLGWIQVQVPDRITKENPGVIRLTVHRWGELHARLGAGIFRCVMVLNLRDERLQGEKWVRLGYPLNVLISGSRVTSVEVTRSLRVGMKPEVKVEIEAVEIDEPSPSEELDPGWWLRLKDAKGGSIEARVPLPLRAADSPYFAVFALKDDPANRIWDAIDLPADSGFELADRWRGELVLQHVERGRDLAEPGQGRVRRHTIVTYLPRGYRPVTLDGEVEWRPPGSAAPSAGESATRRSVGPIAVDHGLYASTDLPLAREPFLLSAVVDLTRVSASDPPLPPKISAMLIPGKGGDAITLDLLPEPTDPAYPSVVRYQALAQLGGPGSYQFKLAGGELPPSVADLDRLDLLVRVVLEGDPEAPLDKGYPVKVFTGSQPFWWVFGEPGFPSPFDNEWPLDQHKTRTRKAMSFRVAPGGDLKVLKLRYEGIFISQDETWPVRRASPSSMLTSKPAIELFSRDAPDSKLVEGSERDLLKEANDPIRYLDLDVDLDANLDKLSLEQQGERQKVGDHPRIARFVLIGVDGQGRPIGRGYSREFTVAVRDFASEFSDMIQRQQEVLALVGLVVVVVGTVIYKRRRRHLKRQAKASKSVEAPEPSSAGDSRDYFTGLETSTDEPTAPEPEPPRKPKPPAPSAEPSYFDNEDPDDARAPGSEYLD